MPQREMNHVFCDQKADEEGHGLAHRCNAILKETVQMRTLRVGLELLLVCAIASPCLAQSFYLKSPTTGTSYGPFVFKNGGTVTFGDTSLVIVVASDKNGQNVSRSTSDKSAQMTYTVDQSGGGISVIIHNTPFGDYVFPVTNLNGIHMGATKDNNHYVSVSAWEGKVERVSWDKKEVPPRMK